MRKFLVAVVCAVLAGLVACSAPQPATPSLPPAPPTSASVPATSASAPASAAPAQPAWVVGAHPLPLRSDGFGEIEPTPAVLRDRDLPTADLLPPPADGRYAATINAVPSSVLARSTWQAACPVKAQDLRYLTMSFWGFDGQPHTGEMIVNASVAEGVTKVFRQLYSVKFPLEEMRVTSPPELDAPPTGDGNNTSAFVCRPSRGLSSWSAHAYGLAIDVNPFCNPYTKGDLVLPELSSAYLDRSWARPGMVQPNDGTVRAFAAIGFRWGGAWQNPTDRMHFTATGE